METAMKKGFILVVLMISAIAGAGQSLINSKAPDFSLPDQHNKMVNLRELAGKPMILLASDKEGTKQNAGWRKAIAERYKDRILIQGVADVRKVPFFLKGSYKKDFQKDPDSIILDWEGTIFRSYGFKDNVANIVLIDKEAIVRYCHAGSAEQSEIEELYRAIDRSMK